VAMALLRISLCHLTLYLCPADKELSQHGSSRRVFQSLGP
jgi:hypothetical protein